MLKFFNKKKDNKGFTLVELVIVVAILAILVGLLAPQYTKYVEKSRKAADASNMDELVKVVKVFAADPANELAAGTYTITMNDNANSTTIVNSTGATSVADGTALDNELDNSVPNWNTTGTKSKKWGKGGASASISAAITVNPDGGTEVTYTTEDDSASGNKFENYMIFGTEGEGNPTT